MGLTLLVLLCAVIVNSSGDLCLSRGLKQLILPAASGWSLLASLVHQAAANILIVIGVACHATFFGLWMVALRRTDVSLALPLTSLNYILTAIGAYYLLGENVSPLRWSGTLLIVFGVALVMASQRH